MLRFARIDPLLIISFDKPFLKEKRKNRKKRKKKAIE
jgi:hypothetical protein